MTWCSCLVGVMLSVAAAEEEGKNQKDAFEAVEETEREVAKSVCQGILEATGSPEGMDEAAVLKRFLLTDEGGQVWYVCLPEECDDAVLDKLPGLGNLTYLAAGKTKVTDAGAERLAKLKSLETLHLWNTAITDSGLGQLKELKGLRFLNLGGTKVTDAGVAQLADLENLEELRLNGTKVTDAVVEHLTKLRKLQRLWLQDTAVTSGAIEKLRQTFVKEESLGGNIRIVRTQITIFHSETGGTSETDETSEADETNKADKSEKP